jgi:fructose-1,6-bisphosphatase/inositol monophosphatase family enzyme
MADEADALTLDRFGALDLHVETKPDLTPVTDADKSAEELLRGLLAANRPDDAVVGEEFGGTAVFEGRQWVLDPIDGTKNFVRGVPVWSTLIALLQDGVPTVGVVSAPALGRRWWASSGEGAFTSFNGVTRRMLAAVGIEHGLTIEERRFTVAEALQAREAFISASTHNRCSCSPSRKTPSSASPPAWKSGSRQRSPSAGLAVAVRRPALPRDCCCGHDRAWRSARRSRSRSRR